ncbi:MAG: hypothetical protein ABIH49_00030 [archaeon]
MLNLEREIFKLSLTNPFIFRNVVRPVAYRRAGGNPERVHDMALEMLNKYFDVVKEVASQFDFPDLHVDVCGRDVMPFAPAEGLDKNGIALNSLSNLFGFLPWGTVVYDERKGNPEPRVYMDDKNQTGYNAQGFPSRGLDFAEERARVYWEKGGRKPLISSVCGLPEKEGIPNLDNSYEELSAIVTRLNPYSEGFVWNPFSPNTDALKLLRTKEVFRESAELARRIIDKDKLLLVKMGPCNNNYDEIQEWLSLLGGFLDGGGNGIVAVNTYKVPKEQVPSKNWGYLSAGASGRVLQNYRQNAINDIRETFGEKPIVIAEGGIDSAEEAWMALEDGANLLAGYTPYIFNGFGLIPKMAKGIIKELNKRGYKTLKEFQKDMGLTA